MLSGWLQQKSTPNVPPISLDVNNVLWTPANKKPRIHNGLRDFVGLFWMALER